jgi:hypothetical protein
MTRLEKLSYGKKGSKEGNRQKKSPASAGLFYLLYDK